MVMKSSSKKSFWWWKMIFCMEELTRISVFGCVGLLGTTVGFRSKWSSSFFICVLYEPSQWPGVPGSVFSWMGCALLAGPPTQMTPPCCCLKVSTNLSTLFTLKHLVLAKSRASFQDFVFEKNAPNV